MSKLTMNLCRKAISRNLTRRQVLERGLQLGLSTSLITSLMARAPEASATGANQTRVQPRAGQEIDSGTFTALVIAGTNDIDPHSSYTTLGSTTSLGVYEMLIRYRDDSTSDFEPGLADSWESNDDGSTYTFTIPSGVLFHDGTPCDAQAVKDSMIRFRSMELGPYFVIARFVDDPENQIEVVDETTVRFNLGRPQPLFLPAMASSYGPYVVSTAAWTEHATDDDPWANEWMRFNAVGSGPYRLIENSLNEGIIMERFDEYHRGWEGNHFSRIVLRVVPENSTRRQLLEQGEADAASYTLTPEDVASLQENPNLQVLTYPSTRVNWAILNVPRLGTVEARRGLSYAFPYQAVIDGAYRGLLQRSGPIPSTVQGADPNVFIYETDLDQARELLLQSGFNEGNVFDYFTVAEDQVSATVAQLFQSNLAEIGFNLEIIQIDAATYNDLVFGDAPAEEKPMILGDWAWWPDYNDPVNQLEPNFLAAAMHGGGSNAGEWVNERFEEIMAEAIDVEDADRLEELMIEAQSILTEQDPPVIYLGESLYYTVLQNDIEGFVANPLYLQSYPFYDMSRSAAG
jgi:peptide/nickel transport system substrate-binding protein